MAKFLGHKEWKKHKARADFKLFVKQCHPYIRLLETVRLIETLESRLARNQNDTLL